MMEICTGFLAGKTSKKGNGGWKNSLLGRGQKNGVRYFVRVEYQDGSKKEGTQKYHGSGRPHIHALFWLPDVAAAKLDQVISATLPEEENLAAYVSGSQNDRKGHSMWEVHEGESWTDPETGKVHLRHTQEDRHNGTRGYFPILMDALRCHQDVQMTQVGRDGRMLVMQYVAKYVAKWSDSSYEEWFSDAVSVTSLQRKVLFEYHPHVPEMVLQLVGGMKYRQWSIGTESGGFRRFRPPKPDDAKAATPKLIDRYMRSRWREDSMSLLEFLRKSNCKGAPAGWLKQLYKERRQRERQEGEEEEAQPEEEQEEEEEKEER